MVGTPPKFLAKVCAMLSKSCFSINRILPLYIGAVLLASACGSTVAGGGSSGSSSKDTGSGGDASLAADSATADGAASADAVAAGDAAAQDSAVAPADTPASADVPQTPDVPAVVDVPVVVDVPAAQDIPAADVPKVQDVAKVDTGPVVSGGCTNPADQAIIDSGAVSKAVEKCAMSTFGDAAKATPCIKKDTGLSDGCVSCFSNLLSCTFKSCMMDCLGGQTPACDACMAKNCNAAFTKCSGLTP